MPVIGPKSISVRVLVRTATVVMFSLPALPLHADRPADILATVNYVATALSGGNPVDAMKPFDKSFANYAKLRDYFLGLTDSSQLVNEVDVTDQQDSQSESTVTVDWTLSVMNKTTGETKRRNGEIRVRLTLQDGKWKIFDFSPIDLFNPQSK